MTTHPIVDKPYRWGYGSLGSSVLCYDEVNPEGMPVAMCACAAMAQVICESLNKTRKHEQVL